MLFNQGLAEAGRQVISSNSTPPKSHARNLRKLTNPNYEVSALKIQQQKEYKK